MKENHSFQEQLSRHLEELQAEKSKTEAHIRSLKKRGTDLSVSLDPDLLNISYNPVRQCNANNVHLSMFPSRGAPS